MATWTATPNPNALVTYRNILRGLLVDTGTPGCKALEPNILQVRPRQKLNKQLGAPIYVPSPASTIMVGNALGAGYPNVLVTMNQVLPAASFGQQGVDGINSNILLWHDFNQYDRNAHPTFVQGWDSTMRSSFSYATDHLGRVTSVTGVVFKPRVKPEDHFGSEYVSSAAEIDTLLSRATRQGTL